MVNKLLLVVLLLLITACQEQPPAEPLEIPLIEPAEQVSIDHFLAAGLQAEYSEHTFVPDEAAYYELINDTLELTPEEMAMLAQNGFVLSDRLAFEDFTMAYAYIFWKDMPVLITTDSILQVIHQNYEDILEQTEIGFLTPRLFSFLQATRQAVRRAADANEDRELDRVYQDLDIYLAVPLVLLSEGSYEIEVEIEDTSAANLYLNHIELADSYQPVALFGGEPRTIDFSQFTPRGHYNKSRWLSKYFQAVTWLAQVDFRLLHYHPETSEPIVEPSHIAAAAILQQAIEDAGQRQHLEEIDRIFTTMIGRSDNTLLSDLERFLADAFITDPVAVINKPDEEQWLNLLTTNDYGQQRITGQIIYRHINNESAESIPRPVSFLLLGQRFAIDSYVAGNLVYDRLMVDGEFVERPLPNPLEVMYALGNSRAPAHLVEEVTAYNHQSNLTALQTIVDELPVDYWTDSIYNRWLNIIRTLNQPTTDPEYPQAMQSAVWADKMLHTQLASWSQLRHDNLLYVKQPVTTFQIVCEYPAAYVEPYPEFYAAVREYAQAGQALFDSLESPGREIDTWFLPGIGTHFTKLAEAATYLERIAEKQLAQELLSEDEEYFLESIIRRPENINFGCGGEPAYKEQWDGWYADLFIIEDESPALVADVHTNPTSDPSSSLFPPRVLHVGTGAVTTALFIAETAEGPTLFVGPAFTYYEATEYGDENTMPQRMNDEEWVTRMDAGEFDPPLWTAAFRLPGRGEYLTVPLVPLSELHR